MVSADISGHCAATSRWIAFRRGLHVVILGATAAWWALFGIQGHSTFLFFAVPVGVVFVLHAVCYSLDRTFMRRRWTATDVLRLALWRTVSPTLALLLVATGFDALYGRRLAGILWLIFAAILAMVGTFRLRVAERIKLQRLKSGEVYKRAFAMAKDMRTPLKRVYVVPAGRGHLTNAYGLSESVAVTDNYGKFLDRAELDFVIGHELGHVKGKHGRRKLVIMTTVFATLATTCFFFPPALIRFRPLLNFILLLIPMLTFYFLSRRFEYAADKRSVEFTHDAKAAIRALGNLYDFTQAPTRCDRFSELFMTHPSLEHRAAAISRIGQSPGENVSELLAQRKNG
jgi:Zn-dependent protease with chaperone function